MSSAKQRFQQSKFLKSNTNLKMNLKKQSYYIRIIVMFVVTLKFSTIKFKFMPIIYILNICSQNINQLLMLSALTLVPKSLIICTLSVRVNSRAMLFISFKFPFKTRTVHIINLAISFHFILVKHSSIFELIILFQYSEAFKIMIFKEALIYLPTICRHPNAFYDFILVELSLISNPGHHLKYPFSLSFSLQKISFIKITTGPCHFTPTMPNSLHQVSFINPSRFVLNFSFTNELLNKIRHFRFILFIIAFIQSIDNTEDFTFLNGYFLGDLINFYIFTDPTQLLVAHRQIKIQIDNYNHIRNITTFSKLILIEQLKSENLYVYLYFLQRKFIDLNDQIYRDSQELYNFTLSELYFCDFQEQFRLIFILSMYDQKKYELLFKKIEIQSILL